MSLEQIGALSYAVSSSNLFTIMAIIPVFEKKPGKRSRRELLTNRYKVMFDLEELQDLEVEFDKDLLTPFKRMMAGLASYKEINRTLFDLGCNLERRRSWIAQLEHYGLVSNSNKDTIARSLITTDGKYRISMALPNYKTIRLICEERDSIDKEWTLDYEKTIIIEPDDLKGQTLLTHGKDRLNRLMCSVISLEPTLQFVRE